MSVLLKLMTLGNPRSLLMLGVLSDNRHGQKAMSVDAEEVRRASEILMIVEVDFFRLAHRTWFGRQASEADVERSFMPYIKNGLVPIWVRHLARNVLRAAESGQLDRSRYGLSIVDEPPIQADTYNRYSRLWVCAALAVVAVLSLLDVW